MTHIQFRIVLPILLLLVAAGCADSKFKSAAPAQGVAPGSEDAELDKDTGGTTTTGQANQLVNEFDLSGSSQAIDMLWIIDNSGSMEQEIEQVRKNFNQFMTSISERADVRLTLISAKYKAQSSSNSGSCGLDLEAGYVAKGHVQIPVTVSSNNAMDLALAASCPLAETEVTFPFAKDSDKICNLPSTQVSLIDGLEFNNARAKFLERMRTNTKKVYVFVTDDNAKGVANAANFQSTAKLPAGTAAAFAFRGDQSTPSCQIAEKGTTYEQLATKTGGQVFDLCESDWSKNFTLLSGAINALSKNAFALKAEGKISIVKVTLNGKVLTAAQYKLVGNSVSLVGEDLKGATGKLIVTFLDQK